jgi:hypothetical protein
MQEMLIDKDPLTGQECWAHIDGDDVRIQHVQNLTSLIERNKALQNDEQYSADGIKNDWWHYANIPNILILKWKQELGIDVFNKDHSKAMFSLLNSPEYKYLKTTTKMHSK